MNKIWKKKKSLEKLEFLIIYVGYKKYSDSPVLNANFRFGSESSKSSAKRNRKF